MRAQWPNSLLNGQSRLPGNRSSIRRGLAASFRYLQTGTVAAIGNRPLIVIGGKAFDGTHPSLLGTYLAACVVYQSVYGTSTAGMRYDYFGAVSNDDAEFLRGIADETVRVFFGRN